jgi:hypothetical protein
MDLFDYLNDINFDKKNLLRTAEDTVTVRKRYPAYVVNKSLSYGVDTVFEANEMNKAHSLPSELQYDFYIHAIRKRKRYGTKWAKPLSTPEIKAVMEFFDYSYPKALEAMKVLSPQQLSDIMSQVDKGGAKTTK